MDKNGFDEQSVRALDLLLHHYWILRSENPEWHRLVREREKPLRTYLRERFGLQLHIHPQFVKLEKIPAVPEAYMGIPEFEEPLDYAIFCCALAFLQDKSPDEQFLLSEMCREIQEEYPAEPGIDWTLYIHRKALIRALKKLMDFGLLRTIDGELARFDRNEEQEVLYEATEYGRYFMRTFPADLLSMDNWQEILEGEQNPDPELNRRHRVYRKLFFSPGVERGGDGDADFHYIRNFRGRLADSIGEHSPYQLRVFRNTAFLSVEEPRQHHTVYPMQKAAGDLILQLSAELRKRMDQFPPSQDGTVMLTEGEFDHILGDMRRIYGDGWTKHFRDGTLASVRSELIGEMEQWAMADHAAEDGMIRILPLLGVLAGGYPDDFNEGSETT